MNLEYRLDEVCCDFQNGIGKGKAFYGSGVKVANIGDLYESAVFSPRKFSLLEVSEKEIHKYRLIKGDILFVRSSLKREGVAYCSTYDSDELCLFSSFMIRVRPNREICYPKFLSYLLRSPSGRKRLINASNTSIITNISQEGLASVKIPLPPLPQQKKIAAILDAADAYRQQTRALIGKYEELSQSLFLEMFGDPVRNEKGWEEVNIRKSSDKFCDGPFGSNLKTEHYKVTGVRVIRLNNIGVGRFIDHDKAFISEEHAKTLSKNICKPGDILIGTMGEPNLRACLLPNNIEKAINKADCLICRPQESKFNNYFLCSLLNNEAFVKSLSDLILGQTRGRISMGRLSTRDIISPPLSLQNQFAERIQAIEAQKAQAEVSLAQAEDLFQALLQKAFKGELV